MVDNNFYFTHTFLCKLIIRPYDNIYTMKRVRRSMISNLQGRAVNLGSGLKYTKERKKKNKTKRRWITHLSKLVTWKSANFRWTWLRNNFSATSIVEKRLTYFLILNIPLGNTPMKNLKFGSLKSHIVHGEFASSYRSTAITAKYFLKSMKQFSKATRYSLSLNSAV